MPYTVVFLWISAGGLAGLEPLGREPAASQSATELGTGRRSFEPSATQLAVLADFGAARGLSFKALAAADRDKVVGLGAYDGARVDSIEAALEQARTSLSALEEQTAATLLARVELELLAHPHLPQAAFLMAECLALQAQAVRPRDPALAARLEQSREALEGPRAGAFGEAAPSPAASPAATQAPQTLRVTGLSGIDELELDGHRVSTRDPTELAAGLHHVRVWRSGRPLFASFVRVQRGQTELQLLAPRLMPCDSDDLAAVRAEDVARGSAPPPGIACQSWAMVRAEGTGIGVAQCSGSRCGAFVHWQRRPAEPFTPALVDRQRLPTWATFAIVGAAAAAATSVVLWQAGAFDTGNPKASSFRYAGVNPQGIRF